MRLRGVEPDDWQAFQRFDEHPEDLRDAWMLPPPRAAAAHRRWAAEQSATDPDPDEFRLVIEARETRAVVGTVNTHHADPANGVFRYGVAVGRPYRRRGYATEAVVLVLRYMFGERRYHKCEVEVYAPTPPR